jgi:hypothetical protein
MSRTRIGAALPILALALLALPGGSSGDTSSPTWAGVWNSDFGRMTLDAGGSGNYVSPFGASSSGTIDGNVNGRVNKGTWEQPPPRPGDPPKKGTFSFTMSGSGLTFTGDWAYDSGGCGSSCGWNGECIEGACLKNDDPPPPPPDPDPDPGCTPRGASAFAAIVYCPFSYGEPEPMPAPAPGKTADITPENLPRETWQLILEILQEEQDQEATDLAAAIAAKLKEPGAKETYAGCLTFADAVEIGREETVSYGDHENTRDAVLSKACGEFLLRQKFTANNRRSSARTAADGCAAVFVPAFPRGTKVTRKRRARARDAARRQLRLSCRTTSAGVLKVAVKARRQNATLNRLLGRRVRSRVARLARRGTTPSGKRLGVRWQARRR